MAVALGSVSHDIYDAAAKMLENKRIQTQLQIAREQIKQQQRSQAMGMAGQAASALNQNQQNRQAQENQAQQRALDRKQQEQNNRIRGMNLLRQAMNKRIDDWNKKVAALREKGFEFDPADMQQMIAMEKKFTDEMKTLSPEQRLQAEQDFHEQFTRFMPKVQRFPDPQSWKFTDPATKQTYPYNPVTKVVDWLHPLGITVDDAERIRKNDEDHKLKMMDQKRKNLEEARAIFKDEYESGSTYNEAADAALATTGIDPKGGVRKSPGDPGFTHTDFKEITAHLNQQKYYDSVMDKVMERAGKNYDEHEDKPSPAGRQKAMTEAWEQSPYFKSYQNWKSKQEAPSAQQASAATQAQPENQLPQEVHEAMQYLQNIKTFMERAAAAGKGDKPFDSAATANTVQAEIRRATDVVEAYQRSNGIVPRQPATQAVAPQQPTAVQQPQPAATQQPQAPQVAPADTGERKGPFKGRIINDNRTSSIGGGGTGLLAMGANPIAEYLVSKALTPSAAATPASSKPFGSTDASRQDAGGDPAFGFRTKMESWLERNPAPGTGPYGNGKLDARYRDWATQRMAVENSQADAFGLPRDQARQVSNRIDGYRDGSKGIEQTKAKSLTASLGMISQPDYPTQGFSKSTLREMQAKADRIVPEKSPVPPSEQWSSEARRNASAESRKTTTNTEDKIDNAYNNAETLFRDESGQWLRSIKGSGSGPDGVASESPFDYTTGRYEKVAQSYVDKLKTSGKDGIRYSEDADGNLVPEMPYGYEQRLAENQKYGDQSKVMFGDRKLFPDTPNGPAAYSLEAQMDNEHAKRHPAENLVTAYLASPNSDIPKGQDKDSALSSSAEANQSITEAANNGLMPFDLKWNYDKTPEWAEKLPAFEWRNKDGKIERQSGFKGADKLIDDVSKSMEVGKYDPATVAAENAAKEQQNAEPPATPNPLPKELTAEHINALRPENQEAYLREPVAPTRKEFDAQMRDQYGDPIGGGNYDADYQAMIDARNAVRSSMPKSVDDAAFGNLFIDKDGTLKRNDNGKPSPVKPNDPLPPGYGQRVTPPQPQQLPQVANPQGQPAPDPRGQQAARQADILRRGAAVRKEMINDPRWKPLIDNKGNFRPLPGEMQRPAPVQQKPQQLGDPMSQRLQTQDFFPPAASSFNQFPQQQQAQLPSYDNSLASLGFSSDYMPQPNIEPVRYDINGMNDYYNAPLQQSAYEQLDFRNYQTDFQSFPDPMQYQNFQQQYPAIDSPDFMSAPFYESYPSGGYYPAGDYNTSSYYENYA